MLGGVVFFADLGEQWNSILREGIKSILRMDEVLAN